MFEQLGSNNFWAAVRFADLIDILLVTVVLAVAFSWMKRRATRPLLVAVALGLIVYGVARAWNLYVTLWLFRVGLIVLVAALLLAFQEDLRRGFERLAAGRMFRRTKGPDDLARVVTILSEATFGLAARQIGALIVIRGTEPLDRHLRGGWAVDAKLSPPLIHCIFDPSTPGHDGAVIIGAEGRLDRMAAHLPLSANLAEVAGRGTRHAAALGLSERSDAMIITVSEERGTVCLARDGRLDPIHDPAVLADVLTARFESFRGRPLPGARIKDPEAKLAAVFASLMLWFALAAPTDPVQRNYTIPVELRQVPQGWTLEGPFPQEVEATLAGPEQAFRDLRSEDLRLAFDVSKLQAGENQLDTMSGKLNAPEQLRIARLGAQTIYLTATPPNPSVPKTPLP